MKKANTSAHFKILKDVSTSMEAHSDDAYDYEKKNYDYEMSYEKRWVHGQLVDINCENRKMTHQQVQVQDIVVQRYCNGSLQKSQLPSQLSCKVRYKIR